MGVKGPAGGGGEAKFGGGIQGGWWKFQSPDPRKGRDGGRRCFRPQTGSEENSYGP